MEKQGINRSIDNKYDYNIMKVFIINNLVKKKKEKKKKKKKKKKLRGKVYKII
jgi:hypothetical protein